MHILIIPSEEYIPDSNPIAGIFQHDQAKILIEKGHQVGALSFSFKYAFSTLIKALLGKKNRQTKTLGFAELLGLILSKIVAPNKADFETEFRDGVNILRCDGFWGMKSTGTELDKLQLWRKYGRKTLLHYIKLHGKPDIIHAHNMIYAGIFALEIEQEFDIPVVITEHSSQYAMQEVGKELEKVLRSSISRANRIYAVSPKLVELLSSRFNLANDRIKWLPNVLDAVVEFAPMPNHSPSKDRFNWVHVANLIPLKGQKELIMAFSAAFKNQPNVSLTIAGQGFLESELKKMVQELELTNRIQFVGLIPRKEVVELIDRSHALVLPSHYETFGVVLIEALSRGKPVLSTYCGGPECIINDTNGLLVEPKNAEELSSAMVTIVQKHSAYESSKLREDCLNRFGRAAFYNQLMEVYSS